MPEIETWADVGDFFRAQVADALRSMDMRPQVETEIYLVRLLSDFATCDKMPDPTVPLVELLMEAMDHQGVERMYRMRHLGDMALFLYGFFPKNMDRRGVPPDYVVSIGGQAYSRLGADGGAMTAVFRELAEHFDRFGGVLDEVREQSVLAGPASYDISSLFERWRRRGSPSVARQLRRRGVFPGAGERGGRLN